MPGESEGPDAGGAGDGFPAPDAPRASVVFKRSLATGARGGARGHAVESRRSRNRNGRGRGGGSNPGRGELARGGRGRRKSDRSSLTTRKGSTEGSVSARRSLPLITMIVAKSVIRSCCHLATHCDSF